MPTYTDSHGILRFTNQVDYAICLHEDNSNSPYTFTIVLKLLTLTNGTLMCVHAPTNHRFGPYHLREFPTVYDVIQHIFKEVPEEWEIELRRVYDSENPLKEKTYLLVTARNETTVFDVAVKKTFGASSAKFVEFVEIIENIARQILDTRIPLDDVNELCLAVRNKLNLYMLAVLVDSTKDILKCQDEVVMRFQHSDTSTSMSPSSIIKGLFVRDSSEIQQTIDYTYIEKCGTFLDKCFVSANPIIGILTAWSITCCYREYLCDTIGLMDISNKDQETFVTTVKAIFNLIETEGPANAFPLAKLKETEEFMMLSSLMLHVQIMSLYLFLTLTTFPIERLMELLDEINSETR